MTQQTTDQRTAGETTRLAITSGSAEDAARIAALASELTQTRQRTADAESRLRQAERKHCRDIALIGQELLREAQERDWCDEYDEFVDSLNGRLSYDLPVRKKPYTVTVTVEIRIEIESATNEDDAREQAASVAASLEREVDGLTGVKTSHWGCSYDYAVSED